MSSTIVGLEEQRGAVREVILSLNAQPIMAEYGDLDSVVPIAKGPPQISCLKGVEKADIVIGLLGERYGDRQESGLSATHEELQHAVRLGKRVILFRDIKPLESEQEKLADILGNWNRGRWIYRIPFDDLPAFASEVRRRLSSAIQDIEPSELIDTTLSLNEMEGVLREMEAQASAPLCAFLAGDWTILKTKMACLIPLALRVRVGAKISDSRSSKVLVYHRDEDEWVFNKSYSLKMEAVIQRALEKGKKASLAKQLFPLLSNRVCLTVLSDVPFGSALHEDAAFLVATSVVLHKLWNVHLKKSNLLRLAGIILSEWYPHISWATLVCSAESSPYPSVLFFDRTEDGGIDLAGLACGQKRDYERNLRINFESFKQKWIPFGLDKISVWLGETTHIDIDETFNRYADPVRKVNAQLGTGIVEEIRRVLVEGGPRSYENVGRLMRMHSDLLTLAGFVDEEY